MDAILSIDDFVDMVRRRFWVILVVALVGCVASLQYALSRGHMYKSSEVIQIVQPKIDDDLAPSTVGGSSARRLQLIQQRLMTRSTVLEIVEKYDLFTELPDLKPSEQVARLRQMVSIEGVAAAREGFTDDGTMSVLTITAEMNSAEKAQQVAHEFGMRTIALSASSRTSQARDTLEFFTSEEEKLIMKLEALEQELTSYRRENDLAIEGNREFRQTQYAAISDALLQIDRDKIALERELAQLDTSQRAATLERQTRAIEGQLESLEHQRALLETRAEGLTLAIETTPKIERELGTYSRRREKLQQELDVISTRRAEAEVGFKLEEQRQAEHLTVIEPASLPDYPITSSRKRVAVLGGFASVILGLFAALLLDLRRPVIRTSAQMQRRVGLTPVVTIPELKTRPAIRVRNKS